MTILSADLQPSPMWQQYASAIARQRAEGAKFDDILEMNVAVKQRDLAPYQAHWQRLQDVGLCCSNGLVLDEGHKATPLKVIDFGAGYGAMLNFWPLGSTVLMVDLPEMLDVQREYVEREVGDGPWPGLDTEFVSLTDLDQLDLTGFLLFAVWSLTETNLPTWQYWMQRAKELAGMYILGHEYAVMQDVEPGSVHPAIRQRWPWERMALPFEHSLVQRREANQYITSENMELVAWN